MGIQNQLSQLVQAVVSWLSPTGRPTGRHADKATTAKYLLDAQEEQEAKAEEEQFPDAAAQERKRTEEAEKWRLQQLKAGAAAEENANFQVIRGPWYA